MNRAMTALVFVFVFVQCAKAVGGVTGFTHGTSFEERPVGPLDPNAPDSTNLTEHVYWAQRSSADTNELAVITNYVAGTAYDYAARKMERGVDGCFAGTNAQYLAVDIDTPLERLAMQRTPEGGISNVLLQVANAYDGIYADTLVKLTPSVASPVVDEADKIIVWLRESEEDGHPITNLVVTAGYYAGDFSNVESVDYVIEKPVVAADTWCRLTVCAISDITGVKFASGQLKGGKNPGFVIYLDGVQAVANASYSIGTGYDTGWLTPAARVLIGERSLFPWLVRGGRDEAMRLSRLSFSGQGAVDDILFTTTRPTHVEANNIFTLKWDAGVQSMQCVVSNSVGVVTNEIDGIVSPRRWDYRIGTNVNSVVMVTNVVYDVDRGYSNGFWSVESGCMLVGNFFFCFGTNPVGRVASSRNVIGVGGEDGYETFAEAKARAKKLESGSIVLELTTNMVISTVTADNRDNLYKDGGYLWVTNGDDIVLDLMGCTLQGGSGNYPTIFHEGGKLCITDSIGGGAVLPPQGAGIAVQSQTRIRSGTSEGHVLTIEDGRYAGEVKLCGRNNAQFRGLCYVNGGSFTNFNDQQDFYLKDYVDPSLYFGLNLSNYWTVVATEAFVWCGEGSNDLWTTEGNWRGKEVPGAGDLAVFPRIDDERTSWTVDFGQGAATKSLWLDADIDMAGTNEFSDVTIVAGTGRLVGTGTATFTGKLPGELTAEGTASEIRLGADWRGTVKISKIKAAKVLGDIMRWGFAGSRVEFAGVRGYLSDRASYALPYELVLTDAADGAAAWKNDTGYTGSIVSFPRLTGSGTFESPKNLREVLQVFQFKDVADFTGCFNLGGKRLLLGTGDVATKSKAGHFTFSNKVVIRSNLGWSGVSAHFGTNVVVYGELGQGLMKYSSATAPSVEDVIVELHSATTNRQCILVATNGWISIASGEKAAAGSKTLMVEKLAASLKAGETFAVSEDAAVSLDGNRIVVNGVDATFADYYVVRQIDGTTYAVRLDEDEVTPTLAEFTVSEDDGTVSIRVENIKSDLWYGLQTTSSLTEDWQGPTEWVQPADGELTFPVDELGTAKFFQVLVTDKVTP